MTSGVEASRARSGLLFRNGGFERGTRNVPQETAIAVSVNGSTHAVMMATPRDVAELAVGLALNERIVLTPDEIERIEIEETDLGIDARLWLTQERSATYTSRRRQMTGPVGCGLCGVESLELAARDLPQVMSTIELSPSRLTAAVDAMGRAQALSHLTRAVHAAAFHREDAMIVCREDVGRHNALDKVAGHLARQAIDPAHGFITMTSRVSVELIQKAAVMGCGLIAAVSAPTDLAIREAETAGITLVAIVRGDEFEIFTHPERIKGAGPAGLADPAPVRAAGEGRTDAA